MHRILSAPAWVQYLSGEYSRWRFRVISQQLTQYIGFKTKLWPLISGAGGGSKKLVQFHVKYFNERIMPAGSSSFIHYRLN